MRVRTPYVAESLYSAILSLIAAAVAVAALNLQQQKRGDCRLQEEQPLN